MTDAKEWYYYNGEAQVGPITEAELKKQISEQIISAEDYVYKEGFGDWKLLKDVPELKGLLTQQAKDKRQKAPRAPIHELVVAHNEKHIASGSLRNISETGVFFETLDTSFCIDEEIKLTLKEGRGLGKPLNLRGKVIRKANDKRFPQGYGIELTELDTTAKQRIHSYISRHQQAS